MKQGCILSPLLFNLFLNDLPECLDHMENDPVYIGTNAVNCLMYADDVIMLSTSKEGLQNCSNPLMNILKNGNGRSTQKKLKLLHLMEREN